VRWQNDDQPSFTLKEGKKRQIRRMCDMVGLKVVGLTGIPALGMPSLQQKSFHMEPIIKILL